MTKNAVDLVRDAVLDLNKVETKAASLTRLLAASCAVFMVENSQDKMARNRLAVMLGDLATEGVAKQLLAWVGKNLAKYEAAVRGAMPEGAEAARDAVLAQFRDRPWREIRSEHQVEKAEGGVKGPIKPVPADGPLKKVDPTEAVMVLVRDLEPEALAPIVDALNALIAQKLDARKAAVPQAA